MSNPFHRILLRGIAESISNRGNCPNNATSQDLFYLYCILEHRPCNLARCLALYLYERGHGRDRGAIAGGAFVCHLALRMRLIAPDNIGRVDGEAPIARVGLIDRLALKNMGILNMAGDLITRDFEDDSDDESDEEPQGAVPRGDEEQRPAQSRAASSGQGSSLPPDFMDRFTALEVNVGTIGGQQRLISSQIGRVQYATDYYQPYWHAMAEREAAAINRPLPPYQPPPLQMPPQVYDGFYVPPTSYYGGPSGSGGGDIPPQPFFGQYGGTYEGGGTDSIFGNPDDMQ